LTTTSRYGIIYPKNNTRKDKTIPHKQKYYVQYSADFHSETVLDAVDAEEVEDILNLITGSANFFNVRIDHLEIIQEQ